MLYSSVCLFDYYPVEFDLGEFMDMWDENGVKRQELLQEKEEEWFENNEDSDNEGLVWCEVGEHYVDPDEMWDDGFADCKNCVSEKEYLEFQQDEETDDEDSEGTEDESEGEGETEAKNEG